MQPHLLVYEKEETKNLFGTVKMTTVMPTKSICTQMKWQKSQEQKEDDENEKFTKCALRPKRSAQTENRMSLEFASTE